MTHAPLPPPAAPIDQRTAIVRMIDAAANRAGEGLRVAEDYVRFVLDDRHLTAQCKQLRHDLTGALQRVPLEYRMAARDTQADVGTTVSTAAEQSRSDLAGVLHASLARAQQALRSLEECCKVVVPEAAAVFESLRYRTYTLQRAVATTSLGIERLADARLCVLIDGRRSLDEFATLAQSLTEAGVDMLQLRDKQLSDRALLERAQRLRQITHGTRTIFIMNDRPDLAVLARADGVHIGQEDLSTKQARAIVGPHMLIGVSTHSLSQMQAAVLEGANYVGVGPTFPSTTKQFDQLAGVELLKAAAAQVSLPAFAIGGITSENLPDVVAAGFTRIAVAAAVVNAPDPAAAAWALRDQLVAAEAGR